MTKKPMSNLRPIGTLFGIAAIFAVVLGALVHAGAADPSGHAAFSTAHESVIPPFRG